MLLIDGIKYELWMPPSEAHFEQIVKEHAPDIFGEQSIYFDIKQKLKAKSGVGSIPDGYAIILSGTPQWYIVEVELSWHPVFEHIVSQMHKFMAGIKNSRKEIADTLYEEISKSQALKAMVESKTKSSEIYRFLDSLVSKPPKLAIIIEEETEELREAVEGLKLETDVVEFRTFVSDKAGVSQHAHLFEPLELAYSIDPVRQFLEELRKQFAEREFIFKPRVYQRYGFIPMRGHKDVHTEWLFWGRGGLGVELHLQRASREENLRLFKKLEPMKGELERKIGEPLTFDDRWGKKWARVYVLRKPIELTDDLKEWAINTMTKFCEVFQPLLDEIDS
jgi:hypothetical protein